MQQLPATVPQPPPPPPHVFRRSATTWSGVHTRALQSRHWLRGASGLLNCAVVSSTCRRFGMFYPQLNTLSAAAAPVSRRFIRTNFWHYNLVFRRDNFSRLRNVQTGSGAHSVGTGGFYGVGGVTRPWRQIHRSPPSSAKVTNGWSGTATPPMSSCCRQGRLDLLLRPSRQHDKMNL